jgi:hypothetical protein
MPKKIVTDESIDQLRAILNNWHGPLTWELYCASVTRKLGLKTVVTKQTLMRYESIRKAFSDRKEFLRDAKATIESGDATISALQLQIKDLAEQVRRLKAENDAYREKFVRWLKNIYTYATGFDMSKLETPLTKKYKRGSKG